MVGESQRGDITVWVVGAAACQLVPLCCAYAALLVTDSKESVFDYIGYSMILVVSLGFMGAVVVDRIVEQFKRTPIEEMCETVLGVVLIIAICFGMTREARGRQAEIKAQVEAAQAAKNQIQIALPDQHLMERLWLQFGLALPAMLYSVRLKGRMLSEPTNRKNRS